MVVCLFIELKKKKSVLLYKLIVINIIISLFTDTYSRIKNKDVCTDLNDLVNHLSEPMHLNKPLKLNDLLKWISLTNASCKWRA